MQGSSPSESNATPDFDANIEPSQVDITSTNGFALQDAVEFRFADLSATESRFQRGGAYAIRDVEGEVLYMGYSKNIATKLQLHERLMPEKCVSFQVYVPPVPPELISPEMLENVLEYWVRENGDIPRGNTVDRALWESENSVDRKVLLGSIFALFLITSIVKQVAYFAFRY